MAMTVTAVERPWLRFYDPGVPHSLTYPAIPLHRLLDEAVANHPNAIATIFFNATLTYREISDLADRFAAGLQSMGVRKGDRVAIMLPNCPQFVIAFYGALRAGAIVVPTNPLYTPREVTHQLADSGAESVVVLSRMYPTVRQALPDTPVRRVIVTNIKEYMPPVLRTLFTLVKERKEGHRVDISRDGWAFRFQDILRRAERPAPVAVSPDDIATLQYTGGTTGVPKAAVLTHRALVANTLQCRAWFPSMRQGEMRAMAVMPFFHSYGLTAVLSFSVQSATAMILMPRFELHDVLKAIDRWKPALFGAVPRIYIAINNSPEARKYDLRSIQACMSGAAPLPLEVAQKFKEITNGGKVVEGYGLTEAAPVTHCNPLGGTQKEGSVGIPFPDVEAKIVDIETGTRDLGTGEVGEIVLRGPNLMSGYYNRPDETAIQLRNGWLHTGDIGKMDEDGYFYIVDRKKEMIIVSALKVYPREVEEVLYTHPAVLEAAAIGIPHPERGEAVKAFVTLKPGTSVTAEDLIAHSARLLTRYKVPIAVEFRPELPKSLVGKVLRRQLAEEEKAKRAQAS